MSLTVNLTEYLDTNLSLTIDTDLFVGQVESDLPDHAVWNREAPGSTETESGLESRIIEIFAQDKTFLLGEVLAYTVYDLLAHKPGFSGDDLSSENIFYCEPQGMPGILHQDAKGRYVFLLTFMVRKR